MKAEKFAVRTLGCKVNQYEGEALREGLRRAGFMESAEEDADVVIVNSCTVTDEADRKTRKLIKRIKREKPGAKIFVTGCYAVTDEDIGTLRALPEVDGVINNGDKMRIPDILSSLCDGTGKDERVLEKGAGVLSRTRAFLKIQDGCDQNCSYCKVSIVRGPSRSRTEEDILAEARRLLEGGYREIVLTGVCIGSWKGPDGRKISYLLEKITGIEGNFRVRISSIEPNHVDDDLIEVVRASDKICKHLHIPLQHGSDSILRSMNRRYTAEQFSALIGRLRKAVPLIGVTTDIIAGFPGESEKDIETAMGLIKEIKPSRLHVFRYSDRNGTPSFSMKGKVPPGTVKDRVYRIITLGRELQTGFCREFDGREVEVLVEKRSAGRSLSGYSSEYVRVKMFGYEGAEGDIITIKVGHVDEREPCLCAAKR